MNELVFIVEKDPESGYIAKAVGEAIVIQADNITILRSMVRNAVRGHYPDPETRPQRIRLQVSVDDLLAP
ncbi:MAG: 2-oxoisovalerate dehydrogenase [Spirulina sp. SIO3F2]|nr:2-oxoisovalerate dehydrogenase [Spirulina sp. SIO3F2]